MVAHLMLGNIIYCMLSIANIRSALVDRAPFGIFPMSIAVVVPGTGRYLTCLLPVFDSTCHAIIRPFILNQIYPID